MYSTSGISSQSFESSVKIDNLGIISRSPLVELQPCPQPIGQRSAYHASGRTSDCAPSSVGRFHIRQPETARTGQLFVISVPVSAIRCLALMEYIASLRCDSWFLKLVNSSITSRSTSIPLTSLRLSLVTIRWLLSLSTSCAYLSYHERWSASLPTPTIPTSLPPASTRSVRRTSGQRSKQMLV